MGAPDAYVRMRFRRACAALAPQVTSSGGHAQGLPGQRPTGAEHMVPRPRAGAWCKPRAEGTATAKRDVLAGWAAAGQQVRKGRRPVDRPVASRMGGVELSTATPQGGRPGAAPLTARKRGRKWANRKQVTEMTKVGTRVKGTGRRRPRLKTPGNGRAAPGRGMVS